MEFFLTTGLSFAQTMPMVWRVLLTLNHIKTFYVSDLCIEDLPIAYRLRSHGNTRFLLFSTSNNPLILKASINEDGWKRKFFFVKWDSNDEGNSLPVKWLTSAPVKIPETFELEELDSYFGPAQVKMEPRKVSNASKSVTSSKATTVPKPSLILKTRASRSRKRKEPNSPIDSDVFPYENHGFIESSKFMIGFLNQGLERLVHLYGDSCGLVKMLEIKLKRAEADVADQATIAATKSKHYEDMYKAMSQKHQATIKKIIQEAQAKYDAAQVQNEQDMASYRESLKGSVVVSLLQTRLKMAYEARAMGLECPSWNMEAWEAKLRNLRREPVKPTVKPVTEEPTKVADADADGGDVGKDVGPDAGEGEAMVEEGGSA
ncbi:hypothetical protein Hanom_Chr06g00527121 [Helianthus anomalus]